MPIAFGHELGGHLSRGGMVQCVGKVDDTVTGCLPNQAVPDSDGAVRAGGVPAGGETGIRIASTVHAAGTYADWGGDGQCVRDE